MRRKHNIENFNVLVAEKKSNFYSVLNAAINECSKMFKGVHFKTQRITESNQFNTTTLKDTDLFFVEDDFLLDLKSSADTKSKIKQNDIILLINSYFVGENAFKIRQALAKNSLNLSGHISLTNYPFNLIKLLVADFIKAKLDSL